jgi:protein O-mannosyl-transferase
MKKAKKPQTVKGNVSRRSWLGWLHDHRIPLSVCTLAFLVYARSLFCGFLRDDMSQIVRNPKVQSWEYLPQLLGSHLWSQVVRQETILFYRPLFSVWMLLVHTLGGLAPWFWHLSNIGLHVAATYLVYRFCRRLTQSAVGAGIAAAIFAVYPIHVDAVSWVSASCEILYSIFALLAMLALLNRAGIAGNKSAEMSCPRVWSSALWFGAALFSKETGLVMLAILPVFAWWELKGRVGEGKRIWQASYPYAVVTAIYLGIRWAVMRRVGVETGEHGWAEVIFSAPSLLLFYLKNLFLPWRLSGCYVNRLTASPNGRFWLESVGILIAFVLIAWLAIRYRSLLGLAAALIVVPVLPALAVIRVYPQGDMTHDRYLYLPSVGLALLVAMAMKRAWPVEKAAQVAVVAIAGTLVVACSAETVALERYYQDDLAFYNRVMELYPSDAYVRGMLGNSYLDQERVDLALEQFQQAHQADAGNQKITLFLARGLFVAGKYHDAEGVLNGLLETPGLSTRRRKSTLLSLANVEISMGNLGYGRQLLDQVDQSDDRFPELHWARGVLFQKQGMLSEAQAEYQKEFEITGDELAQERSAKLSRMIYAQSAKRAADESRGPNTR